MERTIPRHGTNRYFLVFNLYDHTFEEASAHFVPIPALHSQWKASIVCRALVWTAYIKPLKTIN